jgi:tRNA threonylcarbamoyladenosine biosynthesis protein TsaE
MATSVGQLTLDLPDPKATARLGEALAQAIEPKAVVYLKGPLGAGKTALVRALLGALGVTDKVKSPTFTLVETYLTRRFTVAHFDLYRLSDPEELEWMGFRDYLEETAVCFIEWPEKGVGYLPPPDLVLEFALAGEGRRLKIEAPTALGAQIEAKLKASYSEN